MKPSHTPLTNVMCSISGLLLAFHDLTPIEPKPDAGGKRRVGQHDVGFHAVRAAAGSVSVKHSGSKPDHMGLRYDKASFRSMPCYD